MTKPIFYILSIRIIRFLPSISSLEPTLDFRFSVRKLLGNHSLTAKVITIKLYYDRTSILMLYICLP